MTGLGGEFAVVDVSDPGSPVLDSLITLAGRAIDVAAGVNVAFVAAEDEGVHIVDTSDPSAPVLAATFNTPGSARGVDYADGLAYVADSSIGPFDSGRRTDSNTLQIIDVSNPYEPLFVAEFKVPQDASEADLALGYRSVTVSGGIAYLTSSLGVRMVDVSDPTQPTPLGLWKSLEGSSRVFVDGLAYVADGWTGLHIFDPGECGGCGADVNGDGELNVLDFVAFQLAWVAQDPSADCDANGVFDILDFACFQQEFAAGCE
jgi:hypothetical protein